MSSTNEKYLFGRGGEDNISIILARVDELCPQKECKDRKKKWIPQIFLH